MITALPTPPTRSDPATFAARGDAFMTALTTFVTEANDLAVAMNLESWVLATGISTFLTTPSSANLLAAMTNETGTGALVFATSPTLVTPVLGTPTSGNLSNCTGAPALTGTNFTGTAASLTVGNATSATTAATATAANGIKTATTTVSVSGSTAPTSGQVLIASSTTLAAWGNPTTTLNNVTAASGSATIANANNPIAWNWAQSTASQTAFSIGETYASTGGSGSQVLHKIGTLAGSTADPLQVVTRGVDTIRISRTGDVTVTALNGTAGSGTTGSAIAVTAGQGASNSPGGAISITAGAGGGSAGIGGAITITAGGSSTTNDNGGSLTLSAGAGGTSAGAGGSVTITAKNGGASAGNGGSVTITAGNGPSAIGGEITLQPGTGTTAGLVRFNNSSATNGAVATVLGSVGPTGAHTTVQEWLKIRVGVNTRYIPCF